MCLICKSSLFCGTSVCSTDSCMAYVGRRRCVSVLAAQVPVDFACMSWGSSFSSTVGVPETLPSEDPGAYS